MRAGGRGAARRVRSRAFSRCAKDPGAARGVCAARAGRRGHVGGSRWERGRERGQKAQAGGAGGVPGHVAGREKGGWRDG